MEKNRTPVTEALIIEEKSLQRSIESRQKLKCGQIEWHVETYNILKYEHTINVLKKLRLTEQRRIEQAFIDGGRNSYCTLKGNVILSKSSKAYFNEKFESYENI